MSSHPDLAGKTVMVTDVIRADSGMLAQQPATTVDIIAAETFPSVDNL